MTSPQSPAEILDLAHRFDAAVHELRTLHERRNQMIRQYRETGKRGDPAEWHRVQADISTTSLLIQGIRAALLALIPPSPAVQPMSVAELLALPPEYQAAISRWESAVDAAGRKPKAAE
jgi:hypothetical protein